MTSSIVMFMEGKEKFNWAIGWGLTFKSGLHRRPRQRLRQEWPPPPGAIKRNAEAIRFWKYHFEKEGHPSEETLQHLKERITDFETGRILNPTSNRVPLERGPYSKYVLLTPERLNTPMRKNPFAFPNAEPPKNPVINSSMDSSMILPLRQESADDGTTTRWQFLGQSDLDTEILSASSTPSMFLPTLPAPLQINESIEDFEKKHFDELAKLTPVRQQDSSFAPPQESPPKLGRQLSTIQMASSKPVQIVSSLQNQLNPGQDDSPSTDELEFQQLNDVSNHKASGQNSHEFQEQLEKRLKEVDKMQRQEDKLNSQNDSANNRGHTGPSHSKIPRSQPKLRSQITVQSNDLFLSQVHSDPQKASDSTPSQPRDDVMTMSTTPTVILEEDDMATVTGSPIHMQEYEQQLKEISAANEELAREAAMTPVANLDKSMHLSVMEDARNDIDAIYRSFELLEQQIEEWAKERKNNGDTLGRSTTLDGNSTKSQPNLIPNEVQSHPSVVAQPLIYSSTNATRIEPITVKTDEKRRSFYDLADDFSSNSIQNTKPNKAKLPEVPQRSHSRQQEPFKGMAKTESPKKHKKPKEKSRKSPKRELSKSAADLTEAHSIIYADIRPYRGHVQRAEHVHRAQAANPDQILNKTKLNIQLKTVEQQQPVQKIDFSSLNEFDNMEPLYDQPHLESRWNTMTPRSGAATPKTVQRSFSFDLPPPLPPMKLGNGQNLSKAPSESPLKSVPPAPPKHGRRQSKGESLEALKILSDLCKNIENGTISRSGTLSRRSSENLRHYDEEERPFKRVPIDSNEVNRLSSAFTGLRTRGPVTKPQAFNEPSRWSQNDVLGANAESPKCAECKRTIAGSFVKAAGKTYCPEHFNCANGACNRRLIECGFVEENGKKYCEKCFETLIAPDCAKCGLAITAECLNALQKHWHPQCFTCTHCRQSFGNAAFYVENNQPYCERDWNQLFTAKCTSCTFPIEAGDKWVEALGGQFHTNCFNCTVCHISLEGQTFYAREGRPFCKSHA
uniref:Homeobox domain-containing protein n=1 Tax=Bursaphelenchus xylophilus TaxID=6326 RepID=A0A1I7RU56_BURXY